MKKKALFITIISTLVLAGCAKGPGKHFEDFRPVAMQKADILPASGKLKGEKIKVVIFTPDDGGIELAKKSKSGHSIAGTVETLLADAGVEIVDRKIASKLQSEIRLAETKGKSEYQGPDIADYAITGSISTAQVSTRFTKRRSWTSKKGKTYVTPAYCRYTAKVTGNLKLYTLPALTYAKTISINDSASSKTETSNSRCPMSFAQQQSLVRSAAVEAVEDSKVKFQNFFAPKAYVLERRAFEDEDIFKLSAGSNLGFKAGDELNFFSVRESENLLTHEVNREIYPITEGEVVSGLVFDGYVWVAVDHEKADHIRLGDYATVEYTEGFFKKLDNLIK